MASHLHFLNLNGLLPRPTSAVAKGYYNYAAIHGFGFAKNDRRSKKYRAEIDEGKDVNAETELKADEGDENHEAETELDMDGGDKNPDSLSHWTDTMDVAAVLGWMKTFTSHYSAKRSLERHCYANRQEEVEITLLTVGSEYRKISWEDMKLTITATLDAMAERERPSIATAEIIKILEDEIQEAEPTDKHTEDIFAMFRKMISGHVVQCLYRVHCEAALAAFSLYGHSNVPIAEEANRPALRNLAAVKFCCGLFFSISMLSNLPCRD